jgi:hypothetical protein
MADNVTLDPGTGGASIATDDAGAGGHVQIVKLAIAADGSATVIPADATNGILVDVSRVTGNVTAVGTAADGAAVSGNPVLIAGQDGTNTQSLKTDASGELQVDVLTVPTTTVTATDLDIRNLTTTDEVTVKGAAADGAAVAGNPVRIGGKDGSGNTQDIATDTDGNLQVDVLSAPSTAVTNAGTFAVQVDGNALTALQLIDDTVYVDDAAFTVTSSKVQAVGLMADQASTDSVNEGDIGIPRMTLDRKQITTVAPSNDTEGLDTFRSSDIDESEEDVKTSPGKLYGYAVYNDGASEVFLQFWNATAANTTPGTTTPRYTFPIAAGASAHVEFVNGIGFDTAISVGATTGFGDAGAPSAAQVSGTILYK